MSHCSADPSLLSVVSWNSYGFNPGYAKYTGSKPDCGRVIYGQAIAGLRSRCANNSEDIGARVSLFKPCAEFGQAFISRLSVQAQVVTSRSASERPDPASYFCSPSGVAQKFRNYFNDKDSLAQRAGGHSTSCKCELFRTVAPESPTFSGHIAGTGTAFTAYCGKVHHQRLHGQHFLLRQEAHLPAVCGGMVEMVQGQ